MSRPPGRRSWEDQLAVRSPRLYRAFARLMWRALQAFHPGHPVRRAMAMRIITRGYGVFNRNDLEAVIALYHPECRFDWSNFEGWPEDPVLEGPDAMRRAFVVFREAWGDFRGEPSEFRDYGDRMMVTCRLEASGAGSGLGLSRVWWQVGAVRDGLIVLVANYTDHDQAVRAAQQREG